MQEYVIHPLVVGANETDQGVLMRVLIRQQLADILIPPMSWLSPGIAASRPEG